MSKRPDSTYTPGQAAQSPQSTQAVLRAPMNDFDWGDAGIVAAGMLALVALVGGTLLIATHRRRERRFPIATSSPLRNRRRTGTG